MKIILTDTYKKKAKKFLIKHPELKTKYIETLCTLQDSYDNPKLKLHKLKGELKQFWSISINYESQHLNKQRNLLIMFKLFIGLEFFPKSIR